MNFFGWEKAQQGQKYQTRPGRARVEEQELETALPQPPMASGVQFPFQLIMPYGRCPKERVLQSQMNWMPRTEQSERPHSVQVSSVGHTGERCGVWPKQKKDQAPKLPTVKVHLPAFWGSSGCLGQVKPLSIGVC